MVQKDIISVTETTQEAPIIVNSSPKKPLAKQQSQGATTYAAIASRKAEVHRYIM